MLNVEAIRQLLANNPELLAEFEQKLASGTLAQANLSDLDLETVAAAGSNFFGSSFSKRSRR